MPDDYTYIKKVDESVSELWQKVEELESKLENLDYDFIMKIADRKYRELKIKKNPFTAPELLPNEVISDQIKALVYALVKTINNDPSRP